MTRHTLNTELNNSDSLTADRGRWSVSGTNWAIIAILVLAAMIPAAQGNWLNALITVLVAAAWWLTSRMARWRDSSDRERVQTFEPADERERAMGRQALSQTGRIALLFLLAQSVAFFYLVPQYWFYSAGTLLVFGIIWFTAAARAVRSA